MAVANSKLSGVYQIKNQVNNKVYIGSSVDIKGRWRTHIHELRAQRHHSAALQRAWNKYGQAAFSFSVIEIVDDADMRLERESYFIVQANSANGRDGYNTVPIAGTCLGYKHTEETKKKMSEAQLKVPIEHRLKYCRSFVGRTHTEETKAKMSQNSKRVSPSPEQRLQISKVHKGKTISEEHKAIVAEVCRQRNRTPEHIAKVRAALKGRKMSDEARAKLSAATKGRIISEEQKKQISATLKGRVFSDEHRAKISAALRAKKKAQTV